MPANESIPFHETGIFTAHASGAVIGKRFLKVSGNRQSGPGLADTSEGGNYQVAIATAAGPTVGVSAYDAASGDKVKVLGQPGMIVPVTASGAIAAGDEVEVGASGCATTLASGKAVGIAMTGAADGDDVEIKLY